MITLASTIDSHSFGLTLLPLLFSLSLIIGGLYIRRGNAFWTAVWSDVKWEQVLDSWNIALGEDETPTVLTDVKLYWRVVRSYSIVGAGILLLFVVLALTGLLIVIPSLSIDETMLSTEVFWVPCVVALLIGYFLGYAWGVEQMRRATVSWLIYADLRQRHTSDYCSFIVRCIPTLFVVYNIVVAFLAQPYLNTPLSLPLVGGGQFTLVKSPLVVGIIPVLMIGMLLIVETLLSRVVLFPRVVSTTNPVTAQRVDDMIRSVSIGQLICFEFLIISALTFVQFALLVPDPTAPTYVAILQFGGWLLATGLQFGGILLNLSKGQLGGSVSGWWWRMRSSVE